ncbi:MAG: prolyl oligopeptidase family serine peptidase [Planctomycetes bacterium]|nr:prolyl oligopeptidase family serine peptidase [Planctomycetota bacterium]
MSDPPPTLCDAREPSIVGRQRASILAWSWLALATCLLPATCAEYPVTRTPDRPTFAPLAYPQAPRGDVADVHHGVSVPDPYRWLEDPDAPASRAWIEAENALTDGFLASIPARARIRDRLRSLWNFERFGIPEDEGGRTYWARNDGLQQQAVMWVQDAGAGAEPRVLLDPNTLANDGTVALAGTAPSPDGRFYAYALAEAGSDWNVWRIRDVATGRDLPDEVRWVKFSGAAWLPDGSGFYYSRYAEPVKGAELQGELKFQKLYFHRTGTAQADDTLVYERGDQKEWGFGATVTDDGRYLGIQVWRGTEQRNAFFYRDLAAPGAPVVELLSTWDAAYDFIGNLGTTFFFRSDLAAARGRVLAIDVSHPSPDAWRTVVPESEDTLEGVSLVGGRIVCRYLHDAHGRVRVFSPTGALERDVALPGVGTVVGFGGHVDRASTYFAFTGFTTPTEIWKYDVVTGASSVFRRPTVDFRPEDYETAQVFCASKDGTRVPMFLTWKKGTPKDGTAPCLLTGYGGFNVSTTPGFSVSALVWMEMGGVFASANLRGGGEYGREWHLAGTKLRKQNVFDDFIACAEWLVRERWTSSPRLAISGGSNGGLLVGACMVQRPDLFGAVLPAVGVLDMLRYHKFTIGWAWASDYGTVDDAAEFKTLLAYSPLQNLRSGANYPAVLVTTGDHDDRVVPAHSFKFAAALQHAEATSVPPGRNPCLIRIETRAGHGAGKPTSKVIDEAADRWAFLVRVLGME